MKRQRGACAGWFALFLLAWVPGAQALEARLTWDRAVTLSLPVKGVVMRLAGRPGERVEKGVMLVQLDQRPFRTRIDALVARLRDLDAVRAEAKRELERAEALYDRTVLSQHELQLKKNDYIAAQAAYESGRAELVRARLDLEYSTLRAPFAARILERYVEVGQTVVADMRPTPVLRVAARDSLLAVAVLPAQKATGLEPGRRMPVIVDGTRIEGELVAIASRETPQGIEHRIAVRIPAGEHGWVAGQPAVIDLP